MEVEWDITVLFDSDILCMLKASHNMFHAIPMAWTRIGAESAEQRYGECKVRSCPEHGIHYASEHALVEKSIFGFGFGVWFESGFLRKRCFHFLAVLHSKPVQNFIHISLLRDPYCFLNSVPVDFDTQEAFCFAQVGHLVFSH